MTALFNLGCFYKRTVYFLRAKNVARQEYKDCGKIVMVKLGEILQNKKQTAIGACFLLGCPNICESKSVTLTFKQS